MQDYLIFLSGVALLLLLPGPTNALFLAAGTSEGLRRAVPLLAAEILAYGLAITPLVLLQHVIGSYRHEAGIALKLMAISLLLLIAWRMWRQAARRAELMPQIAARTIFVVTLFNPKALVFAFALFPPINGLGDAAIKAAGFAVLAALAGAVWIGMGTALLRRREVLSARIIGRATAVILTGFAIALLLSALSDAQTLLQS